jgi:phosphatidylserine synthase
MPGKISPFILIWYCIISSFFINTFLPYIFHSRIKEIHFNQLRISIPLAYLLLTIIAITIQPTYFSSIIILAAILIMEYIFHCILSISNRTQAIKPVKKLQEKNDESSILFQKILDESGVSLW